MDKGSKPNSVYFYAKFLTLSKIAYTKISAGPGSMLIVSFFLFLLSHLAAALVIRLVDAVLALRGFMKS